MDLGCVLPGLQRHAVRALAEDVGEPLGERPCGVLPAARPRPAERRRRDAGRPGPGPAPRRGAGAGRRAVTASQGHQGAGQPSSAQAAYRVGTEQFGPDFARPALQDNARMVRDWAKKLLARDGEQTRPQVQPPAACSGLERQVSRQPLHRKAAIPRIPAPSFGILKWSAPLDGTTMKTKPTGRVQPMGREATAGMKAVSMRRDRDAVVVWSDEQLLQQFLTRSDESVEAAFATLIKRHGPMVHRVCLDVLRHREEARDAAQAVFLVLARKAGTIRKPEALGPWLHGVALRLARRRPDRRRPQKSRRAKEGRDHAATTAPGPRPDPLGYAELHEEVDRLPEKYRRPIILCYLQGRTQVEAATELGWPLGTVQVRLAPRPRPVTVEADPTRRRADGHGWVWPGDIALRDRRRAWAGMDRCDGRRCRPVRLRQGDRRAG